MLIIPKELYKITYIIDITNAIQILIFNYLQYFIKENQIKKVITFINNFRVNYYNMHIQMEEIAKKQKTLKKENKNLKILLKKNSNINWLQIMQSL